MLINTHYNMMHMNRFLFTFDFFNSVHRNIDLHTNLRCNYNRRAIDESRKKNISTRTYARINCSAI